MRHACNEMKDYRVKFYEQIHQRGVSKEYQLLGFCWPLEMKIVFASCNTFVDMTAACNYCEDDEPMCGPCAIMHVIDFHSPEIGAKLLPYETRIQVM